jgi:DNA (cytosine-5)-methyltransferase 1
MLHWEWLWSAETEPFPSQVLATRHPTAVNLGNVSAPDFIERAQKFGPIDVLVGGPPCQAFSVAGTRGSLGDHRGNLSLRWVDIINAIQPVWAVTENVPGWLSTDDNAFGCFLAELVGADAPLCSPLEQRRWPSAGMVAGPRARAAWRVLDAQYFNVAQRRERVFVVSSTRDWADPSQILFEPEGLCGHHPPRRETRKDVAPTIASRPSAGGGLGTDFDCDGGLVEPAYALKAGKSSKDNMRGEVSDNLIAGTLGTRSAAHSSGTKHEADFMIPDVAWALQERDHKGADSDTKDGHLIVADPVCANEARTYTHEGKNNFRLRNVVAFTVADGAERPGANRFAAWEGDVYPTLQGHPQTDGSARQTGVVAFDTTQITHRENRCQPKDGDPCHPLPAHGHAPAVAFQSNAGRDFTMDVERSPPIRGAGTDGTNGAAVAFKPSHYTRDKDGAPNDVTPPLGKEPDKGDQDAILFAGSAVRRLTPRECERLQAFPDDYTLVEYRGKLAADGPRYKALGNAMCCSVVRWILSRIEQMP